jgi:hypothetical protein
MNDAFCSTILCDRSLLILFSDATRRLAAKDRNGLADPEDLAIELGIGLFEVTELVRRYPEAFDWSSIPIGTLPSRRDCRC